MINEISRQTGNDMIIKRNLTEKKENVEENTKVEKLESNDKYTAISMDGDTLEISEDSDKQKVNIGKKTNVILSEASLKKCSKEKLKQLLTEGKISRQQYDKIVNNKSANQNK